MHLHSQFQVHSGNIRVHRSAIHIEGDGLAVCER